MSRPSASQSAQDMSMAFLRLFEYAVRTSAMAISSTMASSAFFTSSSRMGSPTSRPVIARPSELVSQRGGGVLARHDGNDLEVDQVGPAGHPLLEQGNVVRLHHLEAAAEVGGDPAAHEAHAL